MRTTEKISALQINLLIFPLILATEMLLVPSFTTRYAMQGAWISVLIATGSGYWSGHVMISLAKRYPGMNTIQYGKKILGNWGGTLLALLLVYAYFVHVTVSGNEVLTFIKIMMLPTTPDLVIAGTFLLVCGLCVYAGIETLARCGEAIFYFNLFVFLFGSALIFGDIEFSRMQPVFGEGIVPILKGAVVPSSWSSQVYVLGFLLPYLNQSKNLKRGMLWAMTGTGIIMIMTVVESILVLGNLSPRLLFPLLEVIRYVSIADFLERLDAVIASIWIFGAFVKESIFLFVLCIVIRDLFGLRSHRNVIIQITILSTFGVIHVFHNQAEGGHFLMYTYPISAFLIQTFLPTLLLLLDTVKKKWNKNPSGFENSIGKQHKTP